MALSGLPPVRAGRFFIYGVHDRGRVPPNTVNLRIEAGAAFGTGHHGTTVGCLLAYDRLLKARRFARVLDVGAGTGVLAIAAARTGSRRAVGTDIDRVSVRISRENARVNARKASASSTPRVCATRRAAGAPYDLVFANILARPLVGLSQDIKGALRPGGVAILSGLLRTQERYVRAAYLARGLPPRFRLAPGRLGHAGAAAALNALFPRGPTPIKRRQDRSPHMSKPLAGRHIAVLMGGISPEREVSLVSGRGLRRRAGAAGRQGQPRRRRARHRPGADGAGAGRLRSTPCTAPGARTAACRGCWRPWTLPYTHSGVLASALAMDKAKAKAVLAAAGVTVPGGGLFDRFEAARRHVMAPPYVVKPNAEGSSVGVFLVFEGANAPAARTGGRQLDLRRGGDGRALYRRQGAGGGGDGRQGPDGDRDRAAHGLL